MKKFIVLILGFYGQLPFAGTVNCDADSCCQSWQCPDLQAPYCDIIQGTTGPNGRAMGFCRCKSI